MEIVTPLAGVRGTCTALSRGLPQCALDVGERARVEAGRCRVHGRVALVVEVEGGAAVGVGVAEMGALDRVVGVDGDKLHEGAVGGRALQVLESLRVAIGSDSGVGRGAVGRVAQEGRIGIGLGRVGVSDRLEAARVVDAALLQDRILSPGELCCGRRSGDRSVGHGGDRNCIGGNLVECFRDGGSRDGWASGRDGDLVELLDRQTLRPSEDGGDEEEERKERMHDDD